MKLAVIGSRELVVGFDELKKHIGEDVDELVSGGARGIDTCAQRYARENGIKMTEFLPEYERYGRAAPIVRNRQIAEYADEVLAFWDGKSRGTKSAISYFEKLGKKVTVIKL